MLVVETGAGIVGAESFASVSQADNYWSGRPTAGASWLALTTARKEECLREGTDYVAARLTSGSPLGALSWPWAENDVTAYDLSRVVRATILAADVARLGPLTSGAAQGPRVSSESKTLGPLSKSVSYADDPTVSQANGRDLSFVDTLLQGLTAATGFIIGTRARA